MKPLSWHEHESTTRTRMEGAILVPADVNVGRKNLRKMVFRFFLVVVVCVLTFMRFAMSMTMHMWYSYRQSFDDELLVSKAFQTYPVADTPLSLVKNPGYPLWLSITRDLGLTPDLSQFLIWLVAAVTIFAVIWKVTAKLLPAVGAYAYVLWNPLAFENWLGTRLYRNSLFAPLVFVVLGMLILWLDYLTPLIPRAVNRGTARIRSFRVINVVLYGLLGLCLGTFLVLLLLLTEDSVWCMPLVLFAWGYKIILLFRARWSVARKICAVALTFVPLLPVFIGYESCETTNMHDYGVSLLNTRTEGQVAGFVKRVYLIRSPHQTTTVWAPESSIDQAFSVSPTLSENPKLLWSVKHVMFAAPDIARNPIKGDFLTWQIRFAYDNTFGWKNEQTIQDFFAQANHQIDRAFADGRLHRTDKISLSGMLVPRTKSEIGAILSPSFTAWLWSFNMQHFVVTGNVNHSDPVKQNQFGLKMLGIDIAHPNPQPLSWLSFRRAQHVTTILVSVYRVVNAVFVLVMFLALLSVVIRILRRESSGLTVALGVCGLMVYSWIYCFSVVWFAQYVGNEYVTFFYSAGVSTPFVDVGLLLSFALLCRNVVEIRACRYTPNEYFPGFVGYKHRKMPSPRISHSSLLG